MADWTPLDEHDPLPGDPNGLCELVRRLRREASDIGSAVTDLGALDCGDFWSGEAATAFAEHRGRTIPDLQLVAARLSTSADALAAFVPAMGDCQSRARVALARAREAKATMARARAGLDEEHRAATAAALAGAATALAGPPVTWGPNWNTVLTQAQEEWETAKRQFDIAVTDYNAAADRCANALEPAVHDKLTDARPKGLLSRIAGDAIHGVEDVAKGAVHVAEAVALTPVKGLEADVHAAEAVLSFGWKHIEITSEVLGVVATVTSFVPELAPITEGLTAVKLGMDVAIWKLKGKKDGFNAVRDDMIGLALFGMGRYAVGISRATEGAEAVKQAANVAEDATTVEHELQEAQKIKDAVVRARVVAEKTAEKASLETKFAKLEPLSTKFGQEAAGGWRETAHMLTNPGLKAPEGAELSISPGAAQWAHTAGRIDQVSRVWDAIGDDKQISQWAHRTPFGLDKKYPIIAD